MAQIELVKEKSVIVLTTGQDVPAEAEFIRYKNDWFKRAEEQSPTANEQWVQTENQDAEKVAYVDGKELIAKTRYTKVADQTTNEMFR